MLDYPPAVLMLQTRSPFVTDDLELLCTLQARSTQVVVGIGVTTNNEVVRKHLEPRCAAIPRRLAAMADFHTAGLLVQASLSPLLPCDPIELAALVDAHCDWVTVQPLHAKGPGARTWTPALALLDEHGWSDWLEGGAAVDQAMADLATIFGSRFHTGQEGFSLGWLRKRSLFDSTTASPRNRRPGNWTPVSLNGGGRDMRPDCRTPALVPPSLPRTSC